jgi:proline dehydrogenase
MISFDNTEVAFRGKSNKELKRAYWLFRMVASSSMVKFGKSATHISLKLGLPVKGLIKGTIFKQFCGGETIEESLHTAKKLAERNVKTILDYSIEGKTEEEDFDKTVEEIIATITEGSKDSNIPFAVFKVTGISRFVVLEEANAGVQHLNGTSLKEYEKVVERIDKICRSAHENKVPLFFDAEESWIQDTIDVIVVEMSKKYNKERAIVYNTLQMYRHDRLAYLKRIIEQAASENWFAGFKLVRGAYMEKERLRASEKGYNSPIQLTKNNTDSDFDAAVAICVDHIDRVALCAGTHNELSSSKLATLINEKGISRNDHRVYFAQLLGMSDHISFNLANEGYMVAKYVPYGPVKEVLPYLIRRAEENTSVAGQTSRELGLIKKEISRRKAN